jgi:thiol-disulfide isomerase/thioredoxin
MNAFLGALALAVAIEQSPEAKVVDYLKGHVTQGEPVVVSDLYNKVFTSDADRAALNRLFNTFFKIPLFVAQYQKGSGKAPTLTEIGDQFRFAIPGETDLMLRIMESDPRMPRFLTRDPKSGEIVRADVDAIFAHPKFGKALERTITGWEGKPAPPFSAKKYDGTALASSAFAGKPYLLYFWFTNCPPCMKTSPELVELDKTYRAKGFNIVALNADTVLDLGIGDEARREYARKLGIGYDLAHLTPEVQEAFGAVSVFPTMFFVDRHGTVVKQFVNFQDKATLDAAIRLALQ